MQLLPPPQFCPPNQPPATTFSIWRPYRNTSPSSPLPPPLIQRKLYGNDGLDGNESFWAVAHSSEPELLLGPAAAAAAAGGCRCPPPFALHKNAPQFAGCLLLS